MNSLLQQFYMIPTFRKSLLEAKDMLVSKSSKEDNPFYQIKVDFIPYKFIKNFSSSVSSWLSKNPKNNTITLVISVRPSKIGKVTQPTSMNKEMLMNFVTCSLTDWKILLRDHRTKTS